MEKVVIITVMFSTYDGDVTGLSNNMLKPCIVKFSVLGYFPLYIYINKYLTNIYIYNYINKYLKY